MPTAHCGRHPDTCHPQSASLLPAGFCGKRGLRTFRVDRVDCNAFCQFAGRIIVCIHLGFLQCIQPFFCFWIDGTDRCSKVVKGIPLRIHSCIKDFCVRGSPFCNLVHPGIQSLVCLCDILGVLVHLLLCRSDFCSQIRFCILHTCSHTVFCLGQAGVYLTFCAGETFIDTAFRVGYIFADPVFCFRKL